MVWAGPPGVAPTGSPADDGAVKVAVGLLSLIAVACASPEPSGAPPIAGPPHVDRSDGRGDRVGSGLAFVVDALAISDVDRSPVLGRCGDQVCRLNSISSLGQLMNDQIRQHLLGGAPMLMVELTGVDLPYYGDDSAAELRVYGAKDVDDPATPVDNFQIPAGETQCCRFGVLLEEGAVRPGILGHLRDGAFALTEQGRKLRVPLRVGEPPYHSVELAQAAVELRLPSDRSAIRDGLIGGAWTIGSLSSIHNPFCGIPDAIANSCHLATEEMSLLDVAVDSMGLTPDIDVDGDGLERLSIGSARRVTHCYDGDGGELPSSDPSRPWLCAEDPRMADGFSVAFTFSGVAATITGIVSP